ncbi:MAG: benzoyl-CoA reductase subunit A [Bdellovibrionales bacterium RBG_16_40_8]|nr:MAG: benzoyl-CoA reductase subunit A [Bdellovibrionales bacterium RBG_16_40_8]
MALELFVGIDLGSTTTKAVFIDDKGQIMGRGITNSRSNYHLACQVAKEEGEINTRFKILKDSILKKSEHKELTELAMSWLTAMFALRHHQKQLQALGEECLRLLCNSNWAGEHLVIYEKAIARIFATLDVSSEDLFMPGTVAQRDFFRVLAATQFLRQAETEVKTDNRLIFDRLVGLFDKAIIVIENKSFSTNFAEYLNYAATRTTQRDEFKSQEDAITEAVNEARDFQIKIINTVGTGYGRLTLPFQKEQIRSEILCHGFGAHAMFPNTRTVLDIGGQDTKAIQVDNNGIVTSFQMNDRCAAGCGRYLGYTADEMNMGVHQLGPMAMLSKRPARINSTCTVFAGAELRERLALGEKREDILAGLHRAIILRAMALLARSGGVISEFTFTGGVAKNEAAVSALKQLIKENYGEIAMNISSDSIYTGALGASLYSLRDRAS